MNTKEIWLIQTAEETDIEDLVNARIAYLSEDHGELTKEENETIRRDLPGYFQKHLNKEIFCYIIRKEGLFIASGFLLIIEKPMSPSFINGRTGTVLNVYTKPEYRHQGCGRAIIQKILAEAERLDLCHVELKATEDGYPLYLSAGFKDSPSQYHDMKWVNPRYE